MTINLDNSNLPYLQLSTVLPKDQNELLIKMTTLFNDIAYKVNIREISVYQTVEVLTGQSWFSRNVAINPNSSRPTFRLVMVFPTIAGTATTSLPHGLVGLSTYTFTEIRGTLNLPGTPLFAPIPQAAPDDVAITIDATNVNITTSTGTYNGASAIVVLEYLKN
jgi:hypothetical protein